MVPWKRSIGPYGAGYCKAEQEVVRGPHGSHESKYRVQDYGYPHHHNGGYGVAEVVSYGSNPGYLGDHHHNHHHHHGGVAEVIEKREEIIYDNACDPYRRMY